MAKLYEKVIYVQLQYVTTFDHTYPWICLASLIKGTHAALRIWRWPKTGVLILHWPTK